jgi:N-carbamoyl-L-amino-acid hydrolase
MFSHTKSGIHNSVSSVSSVSKTRDASSPAVENIASAVRANREYAASIFAELRAGSVSGAGVTRDAYGKGEQFAHDLVVRHAMELKLEIARDAACNTYMTLPGRDRSLPSVIIGSHLDSVANGGNYDGAAGVLAGLVAVRALNRIGFQPACDLTVMGVRSEESVWFEHSYIGSRAALGMLSSLALQALRTDTRKSLEEHMRLAGGDPNAVRRGESFLQKDRVRAFIEVHIEQAPVLVDAKCSVGIVTGIPGNFRFPNAKVIGEYGHVGLNRRFRHDAVLAAAELALQLDMTWAEWDRIGRPMAFTIGRFHTNAKEDALTKVAGECEFSLDVRAYTESDVLELFEIVRNIIEKIESKRHVRFDLGKKSRAEAAEVDKRVRRALEEIARNLNVPFISMGSPASHDAAAFSAAGIPIGMIFIRNENGSHTPEESMEIPDFLDATAVLACWLQQELA